MSLFDILRYSGVDISDENVLLNLPDRLLELFWIETGPWANDTSHELKCSTLAWLASLYDNRDEIQQQFQEALKEYSNESI